MSRLPHTLTSGSDWADAAYRSSTRAVTPASTRLCLGSVTWRLRCCSSGSSCCGDRPARAACRPAREASSSSMLWTISGRCVDRAASKASLQNCRNEGTRAREMETWHTHCQVEDQWCLVDTPQCMMTLQQGVISCASPLSSPCINSAAPNAPQQACEARQQLSNLATAQHASLFGLLASPLVQ